MFAKSYVPRTESTAAAAAHPMMQPLEDRRLFAGVAPDAIKVVDVGGPVDEMVEAGGQIFVSAPLASGGPIQRLYAADGNAANTRLLLDLSQPGMKISSIGELTASEDGRIFFTASAVGGRHLFELNTANGMVYQLTTGTNKFYTNVEAAGTRIFVHEGNSDTICTITPGSYDVTPVKVLNVDSDFKASGSVVFFIGPDEGLYRSDGTATGTVKVSGDRRVGRADFFSTNEFVVFEGNKTGENTGLFIVGIGDAAPQLVADDFSLYNIDYAELNGWVYFSGGYYNTSPLGDGRQLYRVSADGVVELASKVQESNGGGHVDGISAVGTSVYFTAHDGQNLPSQGIGDRELYRYDSLTGQTKLVTDEQTLFPIEIGRGVLSSYYFVAAPDKENARFGSRALYRTNPVTDDVELLQGMPTVQDSNGKDYQRVRDIAVGANGFFFTADSGTMGRETDVFFSHTPFSRFDPATQIVTITGTDFADYTTMKVVGSELILNQNGYEERHPLHLVGRIEAFLRKGNDAFASDPSVWIPTYVIGDEGDDRVIGGSGNDTLTGGAGRNHLFGADGDDRLTGAGGRDVLGGDAGDDRIIGNGGNDVLLGGHGSDWIQAGAGDDLVFGSLGADRMYGEDGNDTLNGQLSADLLVGGAGNDYIDGAQGYDALDGGAGVDTLIGGIEDDVLYSNDGELDYVYGGDGNDTLTKDLDEAMVDLVETIL